MWSSTKEGYNFTLVLSTDNNNNKYRNNISQSRRKSVKPPTCDNVGVSVLVFVGRIQELLE